MNTTERGSLVLLAIATTLCAQAQPTAGVSAASTRPAVLRKKPVSYRIPAGFAPHLVTVKFRDGLMVRLRDGALTDLGTGALSAADAVLARMRVGTWSRTHTVAEDELDRLRAIGERNVGLPLADLNLQFRCELPAGVDAVTIIDALNALDCVEMAEAMPAMAPPPQAPDYRYKQVHGEPAPRGTGAGSFHGMADSSLFTNLAAVGGHARIVDIEYGFDQGHLDLPPIAMLTGPGYSNPAYDDHGTAVLGLLGARNDGYGTSGMVHAAQLSFARAWTPAGVYDIDASITMAASFVGPGGIILIEQQIAGPHWVGPPPTQDGMVPVEWFYPTWSTIQWAVAVGMTVVEAAGNGSENLDHPDYDVLVQPPVGIPYLVPWFSIPNGSGALLVGAGATPAPSPPAPPPSTPAPRSRLWFSNYGETLDLQGHGERVTTTGYGDLYAAGPGATYTQAFGGTSSASAVIAGVCGLLQSLHFERRGYYLSSMDLRSALRRSSSPPTGVTAATENIGPLPDLMRAAVELRLYSGLGIAHGFGPSMPGNGQNGLEFFGLQNVFAMAEFDDDGAGPNPTRLYVAGQFQKLGNRPANNIACWNGVGWQELAGGLNGTVRALAVHGSSLYAGGFFPGGVASWNGIGWSTGIGGGLSGGGVYALASYGAFLVAGGDFISAGALPVAHVARFNGGFWSVMGPGLDDRVAALEVYGSQLIAGGLFQFTGSTPARALASWNGAAWAPFGGGSTLSNDGVLALETIPIANSTASYLVVGGTFWSLGGVWSGTQGLAVWDGGWMSLPSSPAQQPFALVGFEDGADPLLPRQRDVYLSCAWGQYRLDCTTWLSTPLPWSSPNAECLFAYDEDGPGVEPPSLFAGGQLFGLPAASAGVGKHFGTAPTTLTGVQQVMPTACGWPWQPTIATTGEPVLGAPFTVQFECLPKSVPTLCVGLPQPVPIPLCGASPCALGVDPISLDFGVKSATYTFPNLPSLVGVMLAFEALEFAALPYGSLCVPPWLGLNLRTSDTLVLTF